MTKFNLITKDGVQLKADGATHEHLSQIIQGILASPILGPVPRVNIQEDVPAVPVSQVVAHQVTARASVPVTKDTKPLYNNDYSIVREDKHGQLTYRSEYDCPNCGDYGSRFIWQTSDYMKCHKCQCHIAVKPTMPEQTNGVPLADKYGFFFFGDGFFDDKYEQEQEESKEVSNDDSK